MPDGNVVICPTTNKLFLSGNGGYVWDTNHNELSPNEAPMKISSDEQGSLIIEYNCSRSDFNKANTKEHLGIRGEVIIKDTRVKLTSISMVGDAIPGTVKDGVWDYASTAADMTYDETEKCYKVTIVTTAADEEKMFRFVGNRSQKYNWHEDSNTDAKMKAKTSTNNEGHAATSYDPNKVCYTENDSKNQVDHSGKDWNIIGTVLLVAGQYVSSSIPIVLVMTLSPSTTTPSLRTGSWSCVTSKTWFTRV